MFTWITSRVFPFKRVLIPLGVLLLHGTSNFHKVKVYIPLSFDLMGLSLGHHGLRPSLICFIEYGVHHMSWCFYHTPISSPRVSRGVCKITWKLKHYVEPPTFGTYDRPINLRGFCNLHFVSKCRDMVM